MARKSPLGCLHLDGADGIQQIRLRLRWLAREWQIPEDRLPELRRGGLVSEKIVNFAEKHGVSLDWLFIGDMKGLHRMMLTRKSSPVVDQLKEKLSRLTPEQEELVRREVDRLLRLKRQKSPSPHEAPPPIA
jgi:hypothetical protein